MDLTVALWIWVIAAALLYVTEMLTGTFYLLPFALGATAALFGNVFGAELWLQCVLFIIVSILAVIFVRPFFKRITSRAEAGTAGVDRLIGKTGVIVEGKAPAGAHRARIERELWNVIVQDGQQLAEGAAVEVQSVDGTYLIVKNV